MRHHAKLSCRDMAIFLFFFQNGGRSIILDLLYALSDHPPTATEHIVVFIIVQNLIGIHAVVCFDNMKVLISISFRLRIPIHAPR